MKIIEIFDILFFYVKSLKSEYLTLITHLISFQVLNSPRGWGFPYWAAWVMESETRPCADGNHNGSFHLSRPDPPPSSPGCPWCVWVPWRFLWLSRELAGSQQGHVCCGSVTLDFDGLAMWGLHVWREDLRAEDVSLKSIPLFICLAVKILGVPAASLLLGGSGALRTWGMGCRSGSPQLPPFPDDCCLSPAWVCQWSQQMGKLRLY